MDEFIIIIILIMAALLVWVIYSIIQNRNNTEAEAKAKLYKAQADLCDATRQLFNTNMHVVDLMTGIEFEHFVAELLPDFGYRNVQVTKASGDEGADVIAVNQNGARVCIQCKHYSGSVGFDAVKEVYTAKSLYACDIAMVITNSYFTKQAMESAQRLDVKLYDRDKLWSIMSTSFEMKLDNYREARDRTNALLDERYGMDDRFKREHIKHQIMTRISNQQAAVQCAINSTNWINEDIKGSALTFQQCRSFDFISGSKSFASFDCFLHR